MKKKFLKPNTTALKKKKRSNEPGYMITYTGIPRHVSMKNISCSRNDSGRLILSKEALILEKEKKKEKPMIMIQSKPAINLC